MKLTWQFKLPKFSKKRVALLEHGDTIWKSSIAFLAVLVVGLILFDAYVFMFRTEVPSTVNVTAVLENELNRLNKKLLETANQTLEERAERLRRAGDNLPSNDPFR